MEWLIGRLSFDYLPHEPATLGAAVMMPLGVLSIAALITYIKNGHGFGRIGLLGLMRKKLVTMYLVVALIMLVRGVADA